MPTSKQLPKLHEIQWDILNKMKFQKSSRFNDLKPVDMDPKQFTYHLKQLVKLGIIQKEEGRYMISEKGKIILSFFPERFDITEIAVDTYILLYIKKGKKVLSVKRKESPYLGHIGVLCELPKKDEFFEQSAKKRLEKTGLKGELKLRMIIEVLYKSEGKSIRGHASMIVFYCEEPKGNIIEADEEGELNWIYPKELLESKKGYDNSRDLVKYFEGNEKVDGIREISRTYSTPW